MKQNFDLATVNSYFVVPWFSLSESASSYDMDCGSDRRTLLPVPKLRRTCCSEPSVALEVVKQILGDHSNDRFNRASVDNETLGALEIGWSPYPLAHRSLLREMMGFRVTIINLSYCRDHSFTPCSPTHGIALVRHRYGASPLRRLD